MRVVALAALLMAMSPLTAAAANKGQHDWSQLQGVSINDIQPSFNPEDLRNAQINARVFGALEKTLGGKAPVLKQADKVPDGFHAYADPKTNTYYLDPIAYAALATETDPAHSGALNALPHEFSHLRQAAAVYASTPDAEGGAQAFADDVSPLAAAAAGTRYDQTRNYDGSYAPYVAQARAKGRAWIYGTQFGHDPVYP